VLHLNVSKVDRDVGHVALVFQVYVPNVSSVFRSMLPMFLLDVTKIDIVLHMLWCPGHTCRSLKGGRGVGKPMNCPPAYSRWAPCMHQGVEGSRAIGAGNKVDVDRDAAPAWAWKTEQRGPSHEAGTSMWAGAIGESVQTTLAPGSDFRALAVHPNQTSAR
jgi:hypothetical protein